MALSLKDRVLNQLHAEHYNRPDHEIDQILNDLTNEELLRRISDELDEHISDMIARQGSSTFRISHI